MEKRSYTNNWLPVLLLIVMALIGVILVGTLSAPEKEKPGPEQALTLAHQRAIAAGFTDGKTVARPSLGEDARVEYSTLCYFYSPANSDRTGVIVCDEHTTIIYDGDRGVINIHPQALKIVPELLQNMPPGTDLYITVVEEAAKIDQMIFWFDQGRLYTENTN